MLIESLDVEAGVGEPGEASGGVSGADMPQPLPKVQESSGGTCPVHVAALSARPVDPSTGPTPEKRSAKRGRSEGTTRLHSEGSWTGRNYHAA